MSGAMMIDVAHIGALEQIAQRLGIDDSPLIGMMVLLWGEMHRTGTQVWLLADVIGRIEEITTRDASDVIDFLVDGGFIERIDGSEVVRLRLPTVLFEGGTR